MKNKYSWKAVPNSGNLLKSGAKKKRSAAPSWKEDSTIKMAAEEESRKKVPHERPAFVKKAKRSKLKNEPFIGMWKDRDDMRDSLTWVRDLRRRHWKA
jgi:hypothetical protein